MPRLQSPTDFHRQTAAVPVPVPVDHAVFVILAINSPLDLEVPGSNLITCEASPSLRA